MGKILHKLKRTTAFFTLIFIIAAILPAENHTAAAQSSVIVEQLSNTEIKISGSGSVMNGKISIDVYRPGFCADDLKSGDLIANMSAIAYHDQFSADVKGEFEKVIRISGESGIYTLCLGGAAEYSGEFYFENIPDTADEEKEFSLDFEDKSLPDGGWDRLSGTGAEFKYASKLGENVFSVKSGTTGFTELSKNISAAAKSGVYKLSFDFVAESADYNTYVTVSDSNGNRAEVIAIKQSKIGILPGLSGYTPETTMSFSINEKHNVEVYFDMDMRRTYWCFDGEYEGSTSTNDVLADIKKVSFHVNEKSESRMYFDNVTFSKIISCGKNLNDINCGAYGINDTMWLKTESENTGNIFSGDTEVSFDVSAGSRYGKRNGAVVLSAEVTDADDKCVLSKRFDAVLTDGGLTDEIRLGSFPYGIYSLNLSLNIGAEKAVSFLSEFSVVNISSGKTNDKSGISTHFYNGKNNPEKLLGTIGKGGIGLIRDDIRWNVVESKLGEYVIPDNLLKELEYAKENDIDVMLILGNGNTLYENTSPPTTNAALDAFEEYCYQAALKTKGYAKYFEVWNEFNHSDNKSKPGYTTQTYANILMRAYRAVKRANPDAVVFLGGLCRVGSPLDEDYEWLDELLPKITGENMCFDAVSIHPYRFLSPENGQFKETVKAFKDYLSVKGLSDIPLWISEMGWPSYKTLRNQISLKEQAEYLVRMLAINDAYSLAERVIWYDLENDGTLASDTESNFGLLNNKTYMPTANSAKPSYLAYANYNAMTYGYTPCGGEERADGTLVSKYENNGDMLYICQNASSDVSINVSDFSNGGLVYVYDIFGNAVEFENSVSVGKSPIYIKVKSASLTIANISDNMYSIRAEISKSEFENNYNKSAILILKQTGNTGYAERIVLSDDFKQVGDEYLTEITFEKNAAYGFNAYLWGGNNKMIPLTESLTK